MEKEICAFCKRSRETDFDEKSHVLRHVTLHVVMDTILLCEQPSLCEKESRAVGISWYCN